MWGILKTKHPEYAYFLIDTGKSFNSEKFAEFIRETNLTKMILENIYPLHSPNYLNIK